MISVSIYRNPDKTIKQFVIQGHAHAADSGEDIVCAAVSVLSQTIVLSLYHIANVDIEHEIKKGYLRCKLPANMTERKSCEAGLLIDTMLLGLKNIQDSYPQYIEISDEGV